jgi:hypothetical protein
VASSRPAHVPSSSRNAATAPQSAQLRHMTDAESGESRAAVCRRHDRAASSLCYAGK